MVIKPTQLLLLEIHHFSTKNFLPVRNGLYFILNPDTSWIWFLHLDDHLCTAYLHILGYFGSNCNNRTNLRVRILGTLFLFRKALSRQETVLQCFQPSSTLRLVPYIAESQSALCKTVLNPKYIGKTTVPLCRHSIVTKYNPGSIP